MAGRNEEPVYALAPEDLRSLLEHGVERRVGKGVPVYRIGDEPHSLWYVVEGRIDTTHRVANGREVTTAFYTPGETFCLAAALIDRPFPCAAVAGIDSTVIEIPASHFKALFDEFPGLARRLVTEMATELCESHCNCALSADAADKRLAAVLLRLDAQFGGGDILFTRKELAQMVGTTTETCIRVLSEWTRQGVIEGNRGQVRLKDREALEAILALS